MDGYTVECREPEGALTPTGPLTTIREGTRTMAAPHSNKLCRLCDTVKSISEFHRKSGSASNSYCRDCANAKTRAWRKANPHKLKAYNANWKPRWLKEEYGLTVQEYERMLAAQGGKCAICKAPSPRTLHIDHCHSTGKVRGLLCSRCNHGLGMFADDEARMRSAIAYLRGIKV